MRQKSKSFKHMNVTAQFPIDRIYLIEFDIKDTTDMLYTFAASAREERNFTTKEMI